MLEIMVHLRTSMIVSPTCQSTLVRPSALFGDIRIDAQSQVDLNIDDTRNMRTAADFG